MMITNEKLDSLLWCPDVEVARGRYKPSHHLGVLYVGKFAQSKGHSVDMVLGGHDIESIAAEIARRAPRVVGISVSASMWRSNLVLAIRLCQRIKQNCSRVQTVLGGIIPTMFAQDIMQKFAGVDVVVNGEGEQTFLEILDGNDLSEIKGIVYRSGNGSPIETQRRSGERDLDIFPHVLAMESEATVTTEVGGLLGSLQYETAHRSASIITARGCNGACTFCINQWYYAPVRERSIEDVTEEIAQLADRGVRYLRVCDANFAYDTERVINFSRAIEPFKMKWSCWQRGDMTDADAYRAMRRSGCQVTTLGIESFDDEIRNKVYCKGLSREKLYEAVRRASEAGLDVNAEVIIGHPTEDRTRLLQGLVKAKPILRYLDYVNISFLTVTPKTVLWRKFTDKLSPPAIERLRLRSMFQFIPAWRMGGIEPAELEAMATEYLRRVYHDPVYLLRQCCRTARRRKRLVWANRGKIAANIVQKLGRRTRRLLTAKTKTLFTATSGGTLEKQL